MIENYYDTFDSYFHGRMSAKESLDFETSLEADIELKVEYNLFLQIKKSTSDIERDKIREQLESVKISDNQSSLGEKKDTKIFSMVKWVSAVAALFIIGFWGYKSAQNMSSEQLFAQNFEVYEIQQSRGVDAIPFPDIGRAALNTPELKLLYSTIKMESNEMTEAINVLNEISDDTSLRDQKYWYLGLANLKSGKITEAKKHFIHLQKLSNYKKSEIEDILSKLN